MPRSLALFALLLLAALACSLPTTDSPPGGDTATPDVATIVAATLTASSADPTPELLETPALPVSTAAVLTVVYAREGDILLWREGESPRALTTTRLDESPRISDDGQVIVFLRNGELYSVRADGTGERPLVNRAYLDSFRAVGMLEVRLRQFDFIPGSREVFFSLYAETEGYPMPLGDLHRVSAEGGAPSIVLAAGQGDGQWTFSPDGRFFALSQGNQIRVLNRDGSGDRVLFPFTFVSTYSEWTYYPQVVWRNDSAGFYTVIPASAALENPSQPTRYYYVPLAEGSPAQLAEFVAVPVWESFPSIAPNGLSVAYVRLQGSSQSLHVIDLSTADRAVQTDTRLHIVNWNLDSRHVVIYNPNTPADVYSQAFGEPPLPLNDTTGGLSNLRWVTETRFLFLGGEELRLRDLPAASFVIDTRVTGYDFALAP